MPTAENARLQYEAGQAAAAMAALTDSGDHITLTSAAALWSARSGYTPTIRPNGVLTGGAVTPDAGAANDKVDIAALTLNLNGVVTAVAAGELTASRGVTTDTHRITSLTVNAAGAFAAVAGVDNAGSFSETRGADGGPPLIPVDSVEIGQVRLTSVTAGLVTAAEIFTTVGTHLERADYPLYEVNYGPTIAAGVQTKAGGSVSMLDALPLIHTGPTAKKVFASYAAPSFANVSLASDFVPSETSHSTSSTQVYGATIGSTSSTLGQGSFNAYVQNGVTDPLVVLKNETLWFRFYPDRYQTPYILDQGKLGVSRTFPAGDSMVAACTISSARAAIEAAS